MKRREFLKTAGLAAATAGGSRLLAAELKAAAAARPNVLFFFPDQMQADVCGAYGDPALQNIKTPHLDRLAREGTVVEGALSTCPLCTPYRGMLMTGRYPTHTGILVNFINTNAKQHPNCLGEVFAKAGYETGFLGKWHLATSGYKNDNKRFAVVGGKRIDREALGNFIPPGPKRLGFGHWAANNLHLAFRNYWYYRDEDKRIQSGKWETDAITDQAIEYMKQRKDGGKPFFLVAAPHPPHPPFITPPGYAEKVPKDPHFAPNVPARQRGRGLVRPYRGYLAMCKNIDDNVGRLLKFLDESGLAKNTIVVFTSDHGTMMGSQGRRAKQLPYAESVNVPLLIRWPDRIPAGRRTKALYTALDHLPTLCGLTGVAAPKDLDGIDLSGELTGRGKAGSREVLLANYVPNPNFFVGGSNVWRGVHTGRYTYAKWVGNKGQEVLFDNEKDPYQMKNLAGSDDHAETLKHLRKHLKALLAGAHDEALPGKEYQSWYDWDRNIVRTGLGPVK